MIIGGVVIGLLLVGIGVVVCIRSEPLIGRVAGGVIASIGILPILYVIIGLIR